MLRPRRLLNKAEQHERSLSFGKMASGGTPHLSGALGREEPEAASRRGALADPEVPRGRIPLALAFFGRAAAAILGVPQERAPGAGARSQHAAQCARVVVWVVEAADAAVGAVRGHLAQCVQRVRAVEQLHDRIKQRWSWRTQLGCL